MATVSTTRIKDILSTLPIGYYLGTRAEVEFSETAPTSMCNPITGKIVVSANNVLECLKGLPNDADTEEFIRDALYHEVSHLILTPKCLSRTNELNIFEDERIESILSKFYMKVNFKRFVFEMNHWKPNQQAKNEIDFFFHIVRFREGPQHLVDKVPELINTFSSLNYGSSYYGGAVAYRDAVEEFFGECCRWFHENKKNEEAKKSSPDQSNGSQQNQQSSPSEEKKDSTKDDQSAGAPNGSDDDSKQDSEEEKLEASGGDEDPEDMDEESEQTNGTGRISDETLPGESSDDLPDENVETGDDQTEPVDDDGEEAISNAEKESEKSALDPEVASETMKRLANEFLNLYVDPVVFANVRRIITRACKKRANRTGVINGFSGKIDPRSVGIRKDYRWLQKNGDNGGHKFDKIHLTLWVDKSGSFYSAMSKVNAMIRSLHQVENMMPHDFSFDVVAMDTENKIANKNMPLSANGGNFFGPGVEEISKKLNRPGWSNYNVVVWDGDLRSDYRKGGYSYEEHRYACKSIPNYLKIYRRAFNVFNNSHSMIVADTSNARYLEKACRNARMKLINCDYVGTFIGTVIELLDHML